MPNDPDSLRAEIESLKTNMQLLQTRVRIEEKKTETFDETPWWKRLIFWFDGWPLYRLADKPRSRPWRRWWIS